MDILDRLLGHDAWTTRQLLLVSRYLSDAQLDREFDIGHRTLRETLRHIVGNVIVWTDLLYQRPATPSDEPPERKRSVDYLLTRFDAAYADFAAFARRIADEHREDETYTDYLDEPPTQKTYGGTIAHLITHSMNHRSEVLHILARLGVPDLLEGDVLSWEWYDQRKLSWYDQRKAESQPDSYPLPVSSDEDDAN